jgi:hypothetical protein
MPCVIVYLALLALGGIDLTDGFCLRTLSFGRPTTIARPILDMVAVSHAIVVTSCKELGWHVNMGLLHLVRGYRFASFVVTLWCYKAGGRPCAHLCPLAQTLIASSSHDSSFEVLLLTIEHKSLSRFRLLCGGNSPISSRKILSKNRCYKG